MLALLAILVAAIYIHLCYQCAAEGTNPSRNLLSVERRFYGKTMNDVGCLGFGSGEGLVERAGWRFRPKGCLMENAGGRSESLGTSPSLSQYIVLCPG